MKKHIQFKAITRILVLLCVGMFSPTSLISQTEYSEKIPARNHPINLEQPNILDLEVGLGTIKLVEREIIFNTSRYKYLP